ncbi:MAG: hypothetical protein QMD10_08960 [Desulfitobacteriaceae bacterium]|nr:hypothetical protein [Desulfitobacteriaceae bacterium]
MDSSFLSNAYTQMKFSLDLAAEYLGRPVILLLLVGILLAAWRVLTPNK